MEMLTSNYEVMFVISKKNDSAHAKAIVEKLLDAIKPEDLAINTLTMESFAYPIKNEKSGYFFVATFRSTSKNIGELNRLLKISSDVLRYLVINTDKNYGAKALKNQKKMKLAETRAKKYEEVRKQAEINEAKGITTPPVTERTQQNPKRPKIQKSQKRYLRNSYRKIGVYFKNEEGEMVYEPIVHSSKNSAKTKVSPVNEEVVKTETSETQVSQAPAKIVSEVNVSKPKIVQPVVENLSSAPKAAPLTTETPVSKLKTTEPVVRSIKTKPVGEVAKKPTPPVVEPVSEPKLSAKPAETPLKETSIVVPPVVAVVPTTPEPVESAEKTPETSKVAEPVVEKQVDHPVVSPANVEPMTFATKAPANEPINEEPKESKPTVVEYEEIIVNEEVPVSSKATDVSEKIEIFEEKVVSEIIPPKEELENSSTSQPEVSKQTTEKPLTSHALKSTTARRLTKARTATTKHKATKTKVAETKTKHTRSAGSTTPTSTLNKHRTSVSTTKVVNKKPTPVAKPKRTTAVKKTMTVSTSERIRVHEISAPLKNLVTATPAIAKRSISRSTTRSKTATAAKKTKTTAKRSTKITK